MSRVEVAHFALMRFEFAESLWNGFLTRSIGHIPHPVERVFNPFDWAHPTSDGLKTRPTENESGTPVELVFNPFDWAYPTSDGLKTRPTENEKGVAFTPKGLHLKAQGRD